MSTRICFLYRLREGVTRDSFERWVREVDAPFATARETLLSYECVRVERLLGSDEAPPYDYVEVLEVTDHVADQAAVFGPEADRIAAEWTQQVADYVIAVGDPVISFQRMRTT